jgi:hypothetical protein
MQIKSNPLEIILYLTSAPKCRSVLCDTGRICPHTRRLSLPCDVDVLKGIKLITFVDLADYVRTMPQQ